MPLAGYAQRATINFPEPVQVGSCVFNIRRAQFLALKTLHHGVALYAEKINRKPREQPMTDIQSLRHDVECESYVGFVGGTRLLGVLQCSREKLLAYSSALLTGGDE